MLRFPILACLLAACAHPPQPTPQPAPRATAPATAAAPTPPIPFVGPPSTPRPSHDSRYNPDGTAALCIIDCFPTGTLVHTLRVTPGHPMRRADGTTVPAAALTSGMRLASSAGPVLITRITPGHPMRRADGTTVPAAALTSGMRLASSAGPVLITRITTERAPHPVPVYTLTLTAPAWLRVGTHAIAAASAR